MMIHTCKSCRFRRDDRRISGGGACHRLPPRNGNFPIVSNTDWCGEYEDIIGRKWLTLFGFLGWVVFGALIFWVAK